jgi:hypothetical protein
LHGRKRAHVKLGASVLPDLYGRGGVSSQESFSERPGDPRSSGARERSEGLRPSERTFRRGHPASTQTEMRRQRTAQSYTFLSA